MPDPARNDRRAETIRELKKRFRRICRRHVALAEDYRLRDDEIPEDKAVEFWDERHEYLASLMQLGDRHRPEIVPQDFNDRVQYRRTLALELRARWYTRPGQVFRAEITSRLRASKKKDTHSSKTLSFTSITAKFSGHELAFPEFFYVHQARQTDFRDLRGILFFEEDLSGADISLSNLELAQFRRCDLRDALLAFSNLSGSRFHFCNIAGTKMWSTDLRGATFARCNVAEGDKVTSFLNPLYTCNRRYPPAIKKGLMTIGRVMTRMIDFLMVFLVRRFAGQAFVPEWHKTDTAPNLGVMWLATTMYHTDASALPTWEAPLFKRYISDEQYLDAVRKSHPTWHWLWGITSDCGRNWVLWAAWSQMIAVLFALVYLCFPSMIQITSSLDPSNFLTYFYFSLVTFTTLGFGDIHAATITGAVVISIQVIIGYIFLGGLVAMLADKLARRS